MVFSWAEKITENGQHLAENIFQQRQEQKHPPFLLELGEG
jgi:hypothetical protein